MKQTFENRARSVIPVLQVADLSPIVTFYELIGARLTWDDDNPDFLTITLGEAQTSFVRVHDGHGRSIESDPVELRYQVTDAEVWLEFLRSRGIEAVGYKDIGDPLTVEYSLTQQITVAFQQMQQPVAEVGSSFDCRRPEEKES